jgi:hypothetical protein
MTIQWYIIYQKLDLSYIVPLVVDKGHIHFMVACYFVYVELNYLIINGMAFFLEI